MTDKITLNTVGNLQDTTTAVAVINNNTAIIQQAFDNTFSLDGTSPNQIGHDVDFNSHQILNLPVPATAASPLRLQDLSSFLNSGTVSNIPTGGTVGQVLTKTAAPDFQTGWSNSVTSVGLSMPAEFTVTNSPVTTTGTLTATLVSPPIGTGPFVKQNNSTLTTPTINSTSVTGTIVTSTSSAGGDLTGTYPNPTVTNSAITNAKLANMAAKSIKLNSTSGSAVATDTTISSLTDITTPSATLDWVMIEDHVSGTIKKTNASELLASGGAGVTSIGGASGVILLGAGVGLSGTTIFSFQTPTTL